MIDLCAAAPRPKTAELLSAALDRQRPRAQRAHLSDRLERLETLAQSGSFPLWRGPEQSGLARESSTNAMQLARRSRFLETEIRSLLSATACQTAAELAQQIQVTREEVLPLLQTLLSDRCVACLQASKGVIYRPYSDPESAVLRALDEAQAPVPLHDIATELPHRVIACALLALVQVGTVEVEASAGDEPLRYRSVPCALLE